MKIFLDDVRVPYDVFRLYINPMYEKNEDWVIVRSFHEFVNLVTKFGRPSFVSFDHDLTYDHYLEENQSEIDYDSLKEKTGYDACKWLCDYCLENNLPIPSYFVHSANSVGKKNIIDYIENFKKNMK